MIHRKIPQSCLRFGIAANDQTARKHARLLGAIECCGKDPISIKHITMLQVCGSPIIVQFVQSLFVP